MTLRYGQQITSIGLATCGKGGARLAARLGIATTRQTILRRIMDLPDPPAESVLFLGIDDFSFLRGRRFGTILVNLETRHVVDLLPDRKAETAASWMRHYPDLMAISRDRGGDYAAAAKVSAPQATQCADRFHVIKNLGEAKDGLAGASSCCSSYSHRTGVKSDPTRSRARQRTAEKACKTRTGVSSKARRASGPIPASRGEALAGLLANGHRCSGGSRSCDRLALVETGQLPRTNIAPAKHQARSPPQSSCREVGSWVSQHRGRYIGNWLPQATPSAIATSTGNSFVIFQKAARRPDLPVSFHAPLCSRDKRYFSCFVALKN
jgi:hypothetical protein